MDAPDILKSWHLMITVSCTMKVPLPEEIKVCIYGETATAGRGGGMGIGGKGSSRPRYRQVSGCS